MFRQDVGVVPISIQRDFFTIDGFTGEDRSPCHVPMHFPTKDRTALEDVDLRGSLRGNIQRYSVILSGSQFTETLSRDAELLTESWHF